jgi:penicillin amidase
MGASLPGTPGVVIGCTDSIAWSVTNAQRDLVDWFKLTYQDQSRSKYLLDGQFVDTRKYSRFIKFAIAAILLTLCYTLIGDL